MRSPPQPVGVPDKGEARSQHRQAVRDSLARHDPAMLAWMDAMRDRFGAKCVALKLPDVDPPESQT